MSKKRKESKRVKAKHLKHPKVTMTAEEMEQLDPSEKAWRNLALKGVINRK